MAIGNGTKNVGGDINVWEVISALRAGVPVSRLGLPSDVGRPLAGLEAGGISPEQRALLRQITGTRGGISAARFAPDAKAALGQGLNRRVAFFLAALYISGRPELAAEALRRAIFEPVYQQAARDGEIARS